MSPSPSVDSTSTSTLQHSPPSVRKPITLNDIAPTANLELVLHIKSMMSQAADLTKHIEKSRGSPEAEQTRKKQKKEPVTFSDPTSLVTFIIGKEGKTTKFIIHKEVVCFHSKVLDVAFNSKFIEGQTLEYYLDDTSPGAFKLFMQWLYSQKLVLSALRNPVTEDPEIVEKESRDLAMLWVLADKLEMPSLQNVALKAIEEISDKYKQIATHTFLYIENNTAADSPLRRYTVANCAKFDLEDFTMHEIPYQLLREFGLYMLRRERGLEAKKLKVSDYLVKED